jgi:hypothetical protein
MTGDAQVFGCFAIGLTIEGGLGYGYSMRWATAHLRCQLCEQAIGHRRRGGRERGQGACQRRDNGSLLSSYQ